MLNTQGADGGSMAEEITITLTNENAVTRQLTTKVQQWPTWTTIPVPNIVADRMRVEINSFRGLRGGGLNEIVILRSGD